jgi:hypothetical protein
MAVQTQIQTRRGTAATWTSTNPTLAAGEIGFETDTNKFKIGTGSTAWTALAYAANTSPLTTKGDLWGYSTTNARLAVGNDGEQIVADSSTSTGLRYTGTPSASNPLINSAFDVWQRGTSFAVPLNYSTYTADRYVAYRGGLNSGATLSRQSTNDTTNLPFIRYCLRYQRDSGNTATGDLNLLSGMETSDSIRYAGRTITFSFYARAGANYSATSNALGVRVDSGTGTDQPINLGYTGQTAVISSTATLTTTWQRFTYTGTVGATATELGFYVFATPTGTAGANDWYEVTGFQIDLGSVALPYRRNSATIQGELAACQRYYYRFIADNLYTNFGIGFANSTTNATMSIIAPVQMRTLPSSVDFSTLRFTDYGSTFAISALVIDNSGNGRNTQVISGTSTSLTINRGYAITANNSTSGYLGFSAEL